MMTPHGFIIILVAMVAISWATSPSLHPMCSRLTSILQERSSNHSKQLLKATVNTAAFFPVAYEIPTYQQQFNYSCGPSSLLTVLQALGFANESEISLMNEMGTNWMVGTNLSQMISAVERRGLSALALQKASIRDIRESLTRGRVVIILYQAWSNETVPYINVWDSGHFSVVFGIDKDNNLLVMDPWTGVLGYIPSEYFYFSRWHAPDPYGDQSICARCMVAVGPREDGTPDVFRRTTVPDSLIFIG
jgi:predicted double-glycine peptidase